MRREHRSRTGKRIPVKGIHSICTHGDSANAHGIAQAIKDRLIRDGCTVQPFAVTMNGTA